MDAQTRTQFGFDFAQYGVRVPTLPISPHIAPRTVFRSPTEVPLDRSSPRQSDNFLYATVT
jgi:phospholipase C